MFSIDKALKEMGEAEGLDKAVEEAVAAKRAAEDAKKAEDAPGKVDGSWFSKFSGAFRARH